MTDSSLVARRGRRSVVHALVAGAVALCTALTVAPAATAQEIVKVPNPYNPGLQAEIDNYPTSLDDSRSADVVAEGLAANERKIKVYSPSMKRWIGLRVGLPTNRDADAGVVYLLNGAGGEEDGTTWAAQTDVVRFMADKQAYIVTPLGGAFSYFTDWEREDPKIGLQKWETFMRYELPAAVENIGGKLEHVRADKRALVGMSMTAVSVLNMAQLYPGFYKQVSSISGCQQTSDRFGYASVKLVISQAEGAGYVGSIDNMWGPQGSENWIKHDPVVNAARFKDVGTDYYIYSGHGLPGPHEVLGDPFVQGDGGQIALNNQMIVGGLLEAGGGACTANLQVRFAQLGIPATFDQQLQGTHSWGYWQDAYHKAWPQIEAALA